MGEMGHRGEADASEIRQGVLFSPPIPGTLISDGISQRSHDVSFLDPATDDSGGHVGHKEVWKPSVFPVLRVSVVLQGHNGQCKVGLVPSRPRW